MKVVWRRRLLAWDEKQPRRLYCMIVLNTVMKASAPVPQESLPFIQSQDPILTAIVLVAAIMIVAFFSSFEASLISYHKVRVWGRAEEGSATARIGEQINARPRRLPGRACATITATATVYTYPIEQSKEDCSRLPVVGGGSADPEGDPGGRASGSRA
jgi:hypothetical protein